jgi:hypothetical protein
MHVPPDREGVERKNQNTQKIRQPGFEIFQISKNTTIIHNKHENNSTGFAGTIILRIVMYYVCSFGNLKDLKIWLAYFCAYFEFSAPRPPCLGARTLEGLLRRGQP